MTKAEGAVMLVLLVIAPLLETDVAAARRLGVDDNQLPATVAEAQPLPPDVSGMKASSGPSDCTSNPNNPPTGPCPPHPSKP